MRFCDSEISVILHLVVPNFDPYPFFVFHFNRRHHIVQHPVQAVITARFYIHVSEYTNVDMQIQRSKIIERSTLIKAFTIFINPWIIRQLYLRGTIILEFPIFPSFVSYFYSLINWFRHSRFGEELQQPND